MRIEASVAGWFASPPPPHAGAVQVLLRPVAEGVPPPVEVQGWLSDDERERASRYVRDADRFRFVEGRALMRFVLGHHLGVHPAAVAFALSPYSKPELQRPLPAHRIRFNLSHTDDLLALALARDGRVGVDVERRGQVPQALEVAASFHPRERALIAGTPGQARADTFLRLWTRKEALLKADGRGLMLPLDSFDVLGDVCGAWRLTDLDLFPGHIGAVACEADAGPRAVQTCLI